MNISIIGTGYVGLCTGIGLCLKGHNVICVDIQEEKVKKINNGVPPFYERGLEEKLKICLKKNLFKATTDVKYAIENSEITFITVGTPQKEDGSIDLSQIESCTKSISEHISDKEYHTIIVKSTVLPGTTEETIIPLLEKSGKKVGKDFGICMNPEFLREGSALNDFLNPDRIIIGEYDKKSGDVLEKIYESFEAPILRTDLKTAEMIKYASNSFLATKVSFINEIGNICKMLGIDVYEVAKGLGLDKRISPKFLQAGCGFGGSCFPKDVAAIVSKANEIGYKPYLLESVLNTNKKQKRLIVEILKKKIDLKNKKIAILGLAFKPGTDDIRESVAIDVIQELLNNKAKVYAYDPLAVENMKKLFLNVNYTNIQEALKDADACLVLTDWPEFKNLTENDFSLMKNKIIIEGRRILDKNKVTQFEGICW